MRPRSELEEQVGVVEEWKWKVEDGHLELEPPKKKTKWEWLPPPVDRPVRVYADGIFDMFHIGHAKMLEQAKKLFPNVHLIVGVCGDKTTHAFKGKTVFSEQERYESARHCKWVDEVIEDAPWVITEEFLQEHKIDYVAHDADPYPSSHDGAEDDVYAYVKRKKIFVPTRRTQGISTTDIIVRIVRDYDDYVRRNLDRGIPAKEMNVSWTRMKRINMKKEIKEIEEQSRSLIEGFINLFGPHGKIAKAFEEQRKKISENLKEMARFSPM